MNSYRDKIREGNEELFEKGNLDLIPELFSDQYIAHAGGKEHQGHDFIRKWTKQLRKAIPDVHIQKIEILNESENIVSWQRTLKGTHKEKLMGILPSHREVTWREIVVSRFDEEKISEEWVVSELAGYLLSHPPLKRN